MCLPIWANCRHLANTIELMLSSADLSPQPKCQIDRFSCFYTAHGMGDLDPIYFMVPWASPNLQSKWHHDRFSCFCTGDRRVALYFTMGGPSPSKLSLCTGGSGPQSNTWFPGPTGVLNSNGISIGSAIFAGLSVTDKQTDPTNRQTTLLGW